jgi:hypothetical protein
LRGSALGEERGCSEEQKDCCEKSFQGKPPGTARSLRCVVGRRKRESVIAAQSKRDSSTSRPVLASRAKKKTGYPTAASPDATEPADNARLA